MVKYLRINEKIELPISFNFSVMLNFQKETKIKFLTILDQLDDDLVYQEIVFWYAYVSGCEQDNKEVLYSRKDLLKFLSSDLLTPKNFLELLTGFFDNVNIDSTVETTDDLKKN